MYLRIVNFRVTLGRMAPSRLTRPPRVAAQRRRLRLSQAQLATTVGITQGALSHIEAGGHTPSVLLAVRIAKALGVPVERLWAAGRRR